MDKIRITNLIKTVANEYFGLKVFTDEDVGNYIEPGLIGDGAIEIKYTQDGLYTERTYHKSISVDGMSQNAMLCGRRIWILLRYHCVITLIKI